MHEIEHRWDVSPEEAVEIQQRLRGLVRTEDELGEIRTVAGVDVGFEDDGATTRAAVAVLDFPGLAFQRYALARRPTTFPYIPGFLSFREVPALLDALAQLPEQPDLVLCDGAGRAHPRRFGLACHLGLLADLPTIGVAKTWLLGRHDPLPDERGAWQPLIDDDEVIGAVVRTRTGTQPLYISVGHRISLETAVDYVLRCAPKYRLPETTRQAHRIASNTDKKH